MNALAGLIVGVMVGITGVGGGSLMSPLLAPATAIGTDLWFAALTKTVGGVHHRQRNLDFPVVGLLALGSVPAALLVGLWLYWRGVGPHTDAVQGLVLIATAVVTLFRQSIARRTLALSIRSYRHFASIKKIAVVTGGAVWGTLVTLTSVGAGAMGVTMLLILYRTDCR